jgi:GGDEF domain-containing protein
VLASGATESALANALNRFSERFMHSPLGNRHPDLSWSAGIVELGSCEQTLDQLLNLADERMYDAKDAHYAVRRSASG